MYFESEYQEILKDFKKELREKQKTVFEKDLSFALLGSPLMQSEVVIISNNWGGSMEQDSDEEMPNKNELLAFPNFPNNIKLRNFLEKIFENGTSTEDFLSQTVYLNACFIRTPYTDDITRFGFELSLPYLKRMLDIIQPRIIICFGNGDNPNATHSISKLLGIGDDWRENSTMIKCMISSHSNCYFFEGKMEGRDLEVFSFPHANNMRWNAEEWNNLMNNKIFLMLKEKLHSVK